MNVFVRRLSQCVRSATFPHLKDKTPIVVAFHKDKSLPFNVLRDVLRFPHIEQHTMESLQHAWTVFMSVNDIRDLERLVSRYHSSEEIWKSSIRLANASPMIMNGILSLWKDPLMRKNLKMLSDTPEILVSSLLYHQKYSTALSVFEKYLKDHTNWKHIVDVVIALDTSDAIKTFAQMYQCSSKNLHPEVLDHLRSLKVKETYINSWNNVLVSQGDFSHQSSASLDKEFQSMLYTSNFRSIKNCLKNVAKYEKSSDWLKPSTTKLLSKYISQNPQQTEAFYETLRCCGGSHKFPIEFWSDIYRHTSIPTTAIDKEVKSTEFDLNDVRIAPSRLKSISKEDLEHFWKVIGAESRQDVLNKSSLSILSSAMKTSSTDKSFDYCLHLLALNPGLKDCICKTFIVEMSKSNNSDILMRLETFLNDNDMVNDKINNYFIYSDLVLGKYHSAISRLERLLSNQEFIIEDQTVDNVIKYLTRSQRDLSKLSMFDDNLSYKILDLTLKCVDHCPSLSNRTWRRILFIVGDDYEMDAISEFFIGIANRLKLQMVLQMDSTNVNHPLRQVFDERLQKKILEWGFMKTPDNPWSGFELIKLLEHEGVYVQKNVMKKHLVRLTKVLHNSPGASQSKRLRATQRRVPEDVSTTLERINGIQEQLI